MDFLLWQSLNSTFFQYIYLVSISLVLFTFYYEKYLYNMSNIVFFLLVSECFTKCYDGSSYLGITRYIMHDKLIVLIQPVINQLFNYLIN